MAGRKPKPTAIKELEGNPGKRKMNKLHIVSLMHCNHLLLHVNIKRV